MTSLGKLTKVERLVKIEANALIVILLMIIHLICAEKFLTEYLHIMLDDEAFEINRWELVLAKEYYKNKLKI